jgi:hypothetical protein
MKAGISVGPHEGRGLPFGFASIPPPAETRLHYAVESIGTVSRAFVLFLSPESSLLHSSILSVSSWRSLTIAARAETVCPAFSARTWASCSALENAITPSATLWPHSANLISRLCARSKPLSDSIAISFDLAAESFQLHELRVERKSGQPEWRQVLLVWS